MPRYICDDVHALASRLARRRGGTLTDAVRAALQEALERPERERAEKLRRVDAILAELDTMPDRRPGFSHDDLYDDEGNPVL